jgi:hypothetical protein
MKYQVFRCDLREDELLGIVDVETPIEALEAFGYTPDNEGNTDRQAFAGAAPRNEFGNPWYPHVVAEPSSQKS